MIYNFLTLTAALNLHNVKLKELLQHTLCLKIKF